MSVRWIRVMATVARFLIGAKEVIFDCSALGIFAIISLWVPSANATDVDAAIVFAVDASDSVDPATADLQREGHAEAICSPEVIAAIARNRVGCIAITYFEWASRGNKRTLLPWTTVCGISDARAAAASIRGTAAETTDAEADAALRSPSPSIWAVCFWMGSP
jgi:hypothetical protein